MANDKEFIPQALIAEDNVVKLSDIIPAQSYLQVGIFQNGNNKSGGGANNYKSYAIPVSELLSGDIGFTPENVANKVTNFTTLNNTLYPTVQAVENRINAIPGTVVYRYERTLTQADVAALNAGTINITPANLGLSITQGAKFHQLNTEWWITTDGIPFTGTGYLVLKTTTGATGVTSVPMGEIATVGGNFTLQTNMLSAFLGSANIVKIVANDNFYLSSSAGDFGGGGANATIKVVLYYEKIQF